MKNLAFLLAILTLVVVLIGPASAQSMGPAFAESYRSEGAGNWMEAYRIMARAMESNENSYPIMMRMAYLKGMMGDSAEAARLYGTAAQVAPDAIEPVISQQYQYLIMGDWTKLISASREGLRRDPKNYTSSTRLGYANYMLGRYQAAADEYAKVCRMYPLDIDVMLMKGWSLALAGDRPAAEKEFQMAMTLSPENQSAKDGMAYLRSLRR